MCWWYWWIIITSAKWIHRQCRHNGHKAKMKVESANNRSHFELLGSLWLMETKQRRRRKEDGLFRASSMLKLSIWLFRHLCMISGSLHINIWPLTEDSNFNNQHGQRNCFASNYNLLTKLVWTANRRAISDASSNLMCSIKHSFLAAELEGKKNPQAVDIRTKAQPNSTQGWAFVSGPSDSISICVDHGWTESESCNTN